MILSVFQSLLLCSGQLLLKIAVQHMDKSQSAVRFIVDSVLTNWWLLGCGILMTGAGLLWMYILRIFPFSNAYPLTALSFVFGTLAAMWFFNEPVNYYQWIGLAFILIGCYFLIK